MTQILVYQSASGVVLATDSRGVAFDSRGEKASHAIEVQKLFQLSPNAIAVTGGAGYGILFCQRFQRFLGQAGLDNLVEILEVAPDFFRSEAESFSHRNTLVPSELNRLYIVIAGVIPHETEKPFRLLFLVSERMDDPVHIVEASNILAIPRQAGMEFRLAHLAPSNDILDRVESLFEDFLMKLAGSDDDIGPPFHFARVTTSGIRIRSLGLGHTAGAVST
jgi:hypothetical protein